MGNYSCWDWCDRDHEHNYGPAGANFGTRRITLTADEREGYEQQFGTPVQDMHDVDRIMKDRGLVKLDRTDRKYRDDMHEWRKSSPESRGKPPRMAKYK